MPNVIVVYRRPSERTSNAEKLSLEHRGLKHIPILEGEDKLKQLSLAHNDIVKIDSNTASLPSLTLLDLSNNKINEISSKLPPSFTQLKVLILSKNQIDKIENLESMPNLDVLDLNDNRILRIENL